MRALVGQDLAGIHRRRADQFATVSTGPCDDQQQYAERVMTKWLQGPQPPRPTLVGTPDLVATQAMWPASWLSIYVTSSRRCRYAERHSAPEPIPESLLGGDQKQRARA